MADAKSKFESKSVCELQKFLKDRGVTFSGAKKIGLLELCEKAILIGIEVDPDGLLEDRENVIKDKLTMGDLLLSSPSLLKDYTDNIALLPIINIDLCGPAIYLISPLIYMKCIYEYTVCHSLSVMLYQSNK